MKRNLAVLCLALSTSVLLTFTSCKKDSTTSDTDSELATAVNTQTDDQSMFSGEDDAVSMEVSNMFETEAGLGGKGSGTQQIPCDATAAIDTITKTVVITFNGTNCIGNRTRTGKITISLQQGKRWRDAGAELTINVQNLKITRVRDNKSITINGTKVIKNVSGGLLRNLPSSGTITHTIGSSGMSVAFDNGTTRTWQIAKKRDFTKNNNNSFVISTDGTHTDGTTTHIAEWGTNRLGKDFSIQVLQPLIIRQDCDFRLTSGKIVHTKIARPITVTFGLDAQGNPTTCPGPGNPYYFKAEWTNLQNVTKSVIVRY
jgi:hypothetical protein